MLQKELMKGNINKSCTLAAELHISGFITPLLNNLKKNPEKEYILWPNRVDKVEQFEDMLRKIYQA